MVKDAVYKIVSITKNSTTSVDNPPENDEYQFNYWEVEGSKIELNSYTFTKNTVVTANITKKIIVNYYVDDNDLLESKNCLAGNLTYFPKTPTKHCKTFKGWSLDKQNVLNNFNFDNDVSLYAVYDFAIDGKYTVSFVTSIKSTKIYFSCLITFDISNGIIGNVKFKSVPSQEVFNLQYYFTDYNHPDIVQFDSNKKLHVIAYYIQTFGGEVIGSSYVANLVMDFNDVTGEWELDNYYNISQAESDYKCTYTFNFERNQ